MDDDKQADHFNYANKETLTFMSGREYSTISSSEEDNDDGDAADVNTSSRSDMEYIEPVADINDHHLTLIQLIREKAATDASNSKNLPTSRLASPQTPPLPPSG